MCAYALKGLVLSQLLQRDRPGGLTSPAFLAYCGASPFAGVTTAINTQYLITEAASDAICWPICTQIQKIQQECTTSRSRTTKRGSTSGAYGEYTNELASGSVMRSVNEISPEIACNNTIGQSIKHSSKTACRVDEFDMMRMYPVDISHELCEGCTSKRVRAVSSSMREWIGFDQLVTDHR